MDVGYTFLGFHSVNQLSFSNAVNAIADQPMDATYVADLLSVVGHSRMVNPDIAFRKYILEAYLDGSLVDRFTFVCRYR